MYTENQYAGVDDLVDSYTRSRKPALLPSEAIISSGNGRTNAFGFNAGQSREMAAALESWWLRGASLPFTLRLAGSTRITFNAQGQALRFYLKITGCWLPLSAGAPAPVKADNNLRKLARLAQ